MSGVRERLEELVYVILPKSVLRVDMPRGDILPIGRKPPCRLPVNDSDNPVSSADDSQHSEVSYEVTECVSDRATSQRLNVCATRHKSMDEYSLLMRGCPNSTSFVHPA